ncbi:MAG TPA: hypothetical protein PLO20_04045, partial [Thermogutta sp.]|nr:hypothetical protein [Thermogutta sp.]
IDHGLPVESSELPKACVGCRHLPNLAVVQDSFFLRSQRKGSLRSHWTREKGKLPGADICQDWR